MINLFHNFEKYIHIQSIFTKKNVKFSSLWTIFSALFLLLLSVTGSLLQYFFSHHFTECKGDPRAHHEEVEVLRAPKNVFNSV